MLLEPEHDDEYRLPRIPLSHQIHRNVSSQKTVLNNMNIILTTPGVLKPLSPSSWGIKHRMCIATLQVLHSCGGWPKQSLGFTLIVGLGQAHWGWLTQLGKVIPAHLMLLTIFLSFSRIPWSGTRSSSRGFGGHTISKGLLEWAQLQFDKKSIALFPLRRTCEIRRYLNEGRISLTYCTKWAMRQLCLKFSQWEP